MMYDWAAKEAICRHMVTVEGKTQDEMLEVLKTQNFNPRYILSPFFAHGYASSGVCIRIPGNVFDCI